VFDLKKISRNKNFELAYLDNGTGEPIVFIHGVGSYKESWDGVNNLILGDYRRVRYDLRGHGDTSAYPGPYILTDFTDDLLSLIDDLGLGKINLVGFSLGGLIAQSFAIDYPERLKRLVLISTIADRTQEERNQVSARLKRLSESDASSHLTTALDRWFTDGFIKQRPDVIKQRFELMKKNDSDSYKAAYHVLGSYDLGDQLHKIDAKTLVITGENDIGSTPRMAAVMKERIQDCRLRILPDFKHSILLEAPKLVAREINDFMSIE
jgi:pimeloyl-ACP methyl ester carboxylesterase